MSREIPYSVSSGWNMLILTVLLFVGGAGLFLATISQGPVLSGVVLGLGMIVLGALSAGGYFTLQPNEAAVIMQFGAYKGTARGEGFCWRNPFNSVRKISLRARNLNGERLKVNDKSGNPIEIAAVVIWRVKDSAKAVFDVDSYTEYVKIQSETAVRHLASVYAYDHAENELSLRGSMKEVTEALRQELQQRLELAGIHVDEARLTHLAYAPEIAQAMLRRQQAEAVIAAREKIVQGAVSMVDMALKELSSRQVLSLDEERKAAMVSNLLVILCGESEAQPIVNTGTLYT